MILGEQRGVVEDLSSWWRREASASRVQMTFGVSV
jgi:hypothetical protein